jgi:putative acetyltransferase
MMASDALVVVRGDLTDPRVVELLEYHVTTALAQSPRESCHAFDVSALQRPEISFWAIWEGEALLGIGALMDLGGGHGEVKSMHTAKAARGRGVGAAMVRHIIAAARERGFRRLSLETGSMDYFAAARALYARHGFVECGPFEGYVPDPNSVFMTLDLAEDRAAST